MKYKLIPIEERKFHSQKSSPLKHLAKHLNNIVFFLVLSCVIVVSVSFSRKTYHPFDAIKELLFHFFVLLACFFLVVRSILTGTFPIKRNLLYIFVFLYLGYNTLSFALSPYADKAYFINLVLLILFFFVAAASVNSERKYTYLLYAIAFTVAVSSIYGFLHFFGYDYAPFLEVFGPRLIGRRVFSFFGNPNLFAAFLVISLPLLLSGFFTKQRTAKYIFATCIVLAIVSLLLTGTRAALLGSSISIVLFFGISYGKADKKRYLWALSITIILVVAGFLYSSKAKGTGIQLLELRQYWWQTAMKITRDHPLFGTGVGSFNVYYPAYRKKSTEIALGEKIWAQIHDRRIEHAHSEFLEVLSDLGILGFLLFLGILFAFFYKYYSAWDPKKKYLVAGNCCAVMALLIHSLYSQNLRFVFVAMFFWLNLALQSALLPEPKTEEKPTLNAGKIIASLLLLPLLTMVFLGHSLKIFSAEYHAKEGLGFYKTGNYPEAEAHLEQAVENNPQDKPSLYCLGISQYRLEKFAKSKETLLKLIEVDPNFLQSHYWLANNYVRTQDPENAKEEFQQSLSLNDAYGPSYYALGVLSLRENDIQQALDYFERAYDLEGDSTTGNTRTEALRRLIEIHQRLGNKQKAGTYAEKLRELDG
ncbi:tetratricopeptide repeat protein [Acidobacteria bacterium AH-259-A15]|nr:tetratricopeptide repeat protein [Acidobacteria bacterium AH-259-A15]